VRLWQAQQVLCRYSPEVVVHIKLPDGSIVELDHLEDHYPRGEGKPKPTVKDRCPMFVAAEKLPEYEYETTSRRCYDVGVDKAKIPVPPEGDGWDLMTATFGDNTFFYFWRRPLV
jgi:hypothetical protein